MKKTCRKDINALRKGAKTVKTEKGRCTKMYAMNTERKKLLKQRREKALQNTKDRKSAKENFLTALKASCKADKASKDTQSGRKSNDELINGANADTIPPVDNIDNIEIVAENVGNATQNAENIDIDSTNGDNIDNAETENEKPKEFIMSDDNIDKAAEGEKNIDDTAMSDNHTSDAILDDDNVEKVTPGEISTDDVPSPLLYGRKMTDPSKVKTSKKCRHITVKPLESSMDDPPVNENVTGKAKGHAFDPTDVQVYEFFIQGTPNPKDLEGVEEDQLLDIQRTIQEKLKERDEERERNITKRMKQYKKNMTLSIKPY